MKEDAVVGVTSNPTIFQKALATGDAYDEQLARAARRPRHDPKEIFLQLAQQDVADACDLLRAGLGAHGGRDGYVSIEVDPTLAYDREATFDAGDAAPRGDRQAEPLVKIPATRPGLAAIEDCIAHGQSRST